MFRNQAPGSYIQPSIDFNLNYSLPICKVSPLETRLSGWTPRMLSMYAHKLELKSGFDKLMYMLDFQRQGKYLLVSDLLAQKSKK